MLQHPATPCNTLQHTALHFNTLNCNRLQHPATHCNTPGRASASRRVNLPFSENPFTNDCERGKHQCVTVRCSLLQFVEVCCSVLQCVTVKIHLRTFARERMVGQKGRAGGGERIRVTHCITLQYTATHCNTLQHTFSENSFTNVCGGEDRGYTRECMEGMRVCMCMCVFVLTDICVNKQTDRQIDRNTDR